MESPDSTDQDSASEDRPEIYARVDHVLDGLQSLLPNQMGGSMQILTEIMRGMRRDISLVPEDQVQQFMRSIGEACIWIADGTMADLEIPDEESEDAGI
jgi:predicted component of type VI protein secretion system